MAKRAFAAATVSAFVLASAIAWAADETLPLPRQEWSFDGVFGTYDRASAQRGFQVYKEVCSVCHPVKHLHFRDLAEIGYSEDEVKAIAGGYQVTDGPNDEGQMYQRPGRASDPIPGPFPNDQAARAANNGALPPDQSLIVKARENGPQYVFGILTGYRDPPPDIKMGQGMRYNLAFPGHQIAMPPPLSDDAVQYGDGTKATSDQEARDVVAFLTWASEPNLEVRKRMGVKVILFLLVTTVLLYAVKRKIWAGVH